VNLVGEALITLLVSIQLLLLVYLVLYNSYRLWLIILSAGQARRRMATRTSADLELGDQSDLARTLTILVPVYNQAETIVESVTALSNSDYPRFDIVVVNDGSTDDTLERLKQGFALRATAVTYQPAIATAPISGTYEATVDLPLQARRLVVISKQNGGKADALNAGINASTTPYVVAVDVNSILEPRALKELMQVVQQDPSVIAVGGQVAVANGCIIGNHQVITVGLPSRSLARFQLVEYARWLTARIALDRMKSVLMMNGGLTLLEKASVIGAGGYLTPLVRNRLVEEYIDSPTGAADESMELIIRLHRYVRDKQQQGRMTFLPQLLSWTTVPETFGTLATQRGRWCGGVRESLSLHRGMLGHSRFGRIGWFALPTFWLFEYLGPLVEVAGYLLVLFLVVMEQLTDTPLISREYMVSFLLASLGYGILVSLCAVLIGAWPFRSGVADRLRTQLLPFSGTRDVLVLLLYAAVENLGYRQLALWWRLRGVGHCSAPAHG
jgi:cellulose synthase/poly-beta-1,6-N-acetylglucosamine synthase-like glycosyltransferase